MDSSLLKLMLAFAALVMIATKKMIGQYWSKKAFRSGGSKSDSGIITSDAIEGQEEDTQGKRKTQNGENDQAKTEEIKALKLLYYQLHNLERFPEVLPRAKRLLLSLLKEATATAEELSLRKSILSVRSFSQQGLAEFQYERDKAIGKEWEQYNLRRRDGGPRELFEDRKEAIWWLQQISPLKYVDGAWLGYVGRVTTPFALQKTMKSAWQILSEELGDGDLEKNHAHLYHNLLDTITPGFPTAELLDFGHPRHQLDELSVWKSALAQLLISLFPTEFLPQVLGFNLHFEAVSMDTLKAGMELKELGIDP